MEQVEEKEKKEEYYLLYYVGWHQEDKNADQPGAVYPRLLCCVPIGKLLYRTMQDISEQYRINYRLLSGEWKTFPDFLSHDYFAEYRKKYPFEESPDGFLHIPHENAYYGMDRDCKPFYEIRSRQSLTDKMKVACCAAITLFKKVDRGDATDELLEFLQEAIEFMRDVRDTVASCREEFASLSECPTNTTGTTMANTAVTATLSVSAGTVRRAAKESANKKLCYFLEKNPECRSWTSLNFGKQIGASDATVRKTAMWKSLSKEKKTLKVQNATKLKLNNMHISDAKRKKLEKELNE